MSSVTINPMKTKLIQKPWFWGIAFVLPLWLFISFHNDLFGHWHKFWPVSLTMFFGAFMAGATSEGGGAFAFPVFTLILKISPYVARDFSWMIQSVGMTCASLVLVMRKHPLFKAGLFSPLIGSFISTSFGYFLANQFTPPTIKIFFVSLWLAFLFAYILILKKPQTNSTHQDLALIQWPLILTGLVGGIFSGLVGSGLDLFTFSVLVLYYKRDIKEATATSVILMALNSLMSITGLWLFKGFSTQSLWMWWAAIPVVAFMAPFGAWFVEKGQPRWVFALLAMSIIVQFFAAFILLKLNSIHYLMSACVIAISFSFFIALSRRKS